ncbi:MAG: hypothetical protein ACFFDT_40020 [Candidatus Hodarchaeota archaeon]
MTYIHIHYTKADEYWDLWCPYCDEVLPFGHQHWYDDVWCTKCNRFFPHAHQWPKGFDIKTGKLLSKTAN